MLWVSVYQQRGTLEGDRGSQGAHFPNASLNAIVSLSKVISWKNLSEKVEAEELIQREAGSSGGLFSPLISLVGCICCRLSPEMPGLYQHDGIWGATVRGKGSEKVQNKTDVVRYKASFHVISTADPIWHALLIFSRPAHLFYTKINRKINNVLTLSACLSF